MTPPLTVGLTGAIAAGKTTALEILGRLGAATISADDVVHELLDAEPLAGRIAERWGEEVVPGGRADRARIGEIVFSDPQELAWLEAEIHPLVGERLASWLRELDPGARVAVAEIPLLFEGEMHSLFDTTIAVVTSDELRAGRADERGQSLTTERERLQLSQEEKARRADHVVLNDGSREDLETELATLIERLAS